MSVVLHYAVPPGFNLASGRLGLTPRLWSPGAYYSLSLVGGPSGCRLGGSYGAWRVAAAVVVVVFCRCSSFETEPRDEKVKELEKESVCVCTVLAAELLKQRQ